MATKQNVAVVPSAPCKVLTMLRLLLRLHLLMTAFCCSTIVRAQPPDSSGSSNQPGTADAAPLVRYVPDQILLAIAVRPHQLLTTEALQPTLKTIDAEDLPQQISKAMTKAAGLDPLKIEQLLVLVDQPTVRLLEDAHSRQRISKEELKGRQSIPSSETTTRTFSGAGFIFPTSYWPSLPDRTRQKSGRSPQV